MRAADGKRLRALAGEIAELHGRARTGTLGPGDLAGATFTIGEPESQPGLVSIPIIHQPQVAILAVGTIEKRPVVRDDAIAIRTMAYFALSFDHRIVDGSDADRFMAQLKASLQEFDETAL